jgi:regulator of sigma E protease
MSYVLTFTGFAALIILHEAGHFAAAKAVGMRVERFSLFFGRTPLQFKRGETEYGIGWIPAGGYVKITGMNPHEALPPELESRAYYNQPPWKRIVVILAGPAVNLLIAFGILLVIFLANQVQVYRNGNPVYKTTFVAQTTAGQPAAGHLEVNDQIVAIDGHKISSFDQVSKYVSLHRCTEPQVQGCRTSTPVKFTVRRDKRVETLSLYPRYSAKLKRPLVGIELGEENPVTRQLNPLAAAGHSFTAMWSVTSTTVSRISKLFESQDRAQVHGIVGGFTVTQEEFSYNATDAFYTLALISLSLAVVNLFPFLPLDGGHVFWAVAEKLRGRRIPFATMERAGIIGFGLILILFVIGLTNDIHTLSGKGFGVR